MLLTISCYSFCWYHVAYYQRYGFYCISHGCLWSLDVVGYQIYNLWSYRLWLFFDNTLLPNIAVTFFNHWIDNHLWSYNIRWSKIVNAILYNLHSWLSLFISWCLLWKIWFLSTSVMNLFNYTILLIILWVVKLFQSYLTTTKRIYWVIYIFRIYLL